MASSILARYENLEARINAPRADLTEGSELYQSTLQLFFEATQQDEKIGRECSRLLGRFSPIQPTLPPGNKGNISIETRFASISQYNKIEFSDDGREPRILKETETDSSCTSCSQAFLRNILPLGLAWDITSEQLTNFIVIGKGLHNVLQKQVRELARQELEAIAGLNLPQGAREEREERVLHQAFSTPEIIEQYGLKLVGEPFPKGEKVLGEEGKVFFTGLLTSLEEAMNKSKEKRIGATIHCSGKTYALALFTTPRGTEYVFFDSHGSPSLNEEKSNAFVKYTFKSSEMIEFLCTMLPYTRIEPDVEKDLTEPKKKEMLDEMNSFICYVIELDEKGILAESPSASASDIATVPPAGQNSPNQRSPRSGKAEPAVPPEKFPHKIEDSTHLNNSKTVEPLSGDDHGKGEVSQPSRIHFVALGFFALFLAALYSYSKPLTDLITSYTSKLGLIELKNK